MRARVLLWVLLMLAGPASADTRFGVVGDPQIGKDCSVGAFVPEYANISEAACQAYQARTLGSLLTHFEDRGITDVFLLGDLTDNAQFADQMLVLRTELAAHPSLTFYRILGNHDQQLQCNYLPPALIDVIGDGDRTPLWQTVPLGKVRFFLLTWNLWGYAWPNCQPDSEISEVADNYGKCWDVDRTKGAACNDNPDDADGQGSCASHEACVRWDDYATAQMTAFEAAVAAYETEYAAGTANAFFVVSHGAPWTIDDVDNQSDNNAAFHNWRRCDGGDRVGLGCSDFNGYTCEVGGGTCTIDIAGFDMRTQFETAALGLSSTLYGLVGHIHRDRTYPADGNPGTTNNGLEYLFIHSTGPAAGYAEGEPLTGQIWTCTAAGACTYETILATLQATHAAGVTMFGTE